MSLLKGSFNHRDKQKVAKVTPILQSASNAQKHREPLNNEGTGNRINGPQKKLGMGREIEHTSMFFLL